MHAFATFDCLGSSKHLLTSWFKWKTVLTEGSGFPGRLLDLHVFQGQILVLIFSETRLKQRLAKCPNKNSTNSTGIVEISLFSRLKTSHYSKNVTTSRNLWVWSIYRVNKDSSVRRIHEMTMGLNLTINDLPEHFIKSAQIKQQFILPTLLVHIV